MRLGGHERFGASGVARSPAYKLQRIPILSRSLFGNLTRKQEEGDLCLNILNTSPLKTIVTPDRRRADFRSKFEVCPLDTMLNFQFVFEGMRCANLHLVRLGDLCLSLGAGSFDVLI